MPRCRIIPQPSHRVSFRIDGQERLAWHHGEDYPRPFFYPVIGPAGESLTRMGHPGAPNHDHHLSVWFAHHAVNGVSFWADHGEGRIRQAQWLCYDDGEEHAAMAVRLHWLGGKGTGPVMLTQTVVAILRPLPDEEFLLELQSTFVQEKDRVTFEKSNFGILAVRVAKSVSAYFGGGKLTNSEGMEDENNLFGQYAAWVDYSGPVKDDEVWNGITYFDHPANPGHPAHWHVREDGWMGASLTRLQPIEVTAENPLAVRYLLHVHGGKVVPDTAATVARAFEALPLWQVVKSSRKHTAYELQSS